MVKLPIEKIEKLWPKELRGARIGAVLHPASVLPNLAHASELLSQASMPFKLAALFGPQHGFLGHTQDNMIEWKSENHHTLGIPVYSLYSETREPTPSMLQGLDALLVDLQDVGARYYTFIWTLYLCAQACEKKGIPLIVCDRPNPIGSTVEGPVLQIEYKSFVGLHPIPVRHGLTIGQLAQQFKKEVFTQLDLIVLEMDNWHPEIEWESTGLPWVLPSPNMPTLETALVYPGQCLLEGTNVSEGRGTTRPFEIFGAPWIDALELAAELKKADLPGVFFRPLAFEPTFHKYRQKLCQGLQIHVRDKNAFKPFATTVTILSLLRQLYPKFFAWKAPPYEYEHIKLPIEILLGGPVDTYFPGPASLVESIDPTR